MISQIFTKWKPCSFLSNTLGQTIPELRSKWLCEGENDYLMVHFNFPCLHHTTGSPTFTVEPQNVMVSHGDTALVDCVAQGEPEPMIRWQKNGFRVIPGGRLAILPNNTLKVYIICTLTYHFLLHVFLFLYRMCLMQCLCHEFWCMFLSYNKSVHWVVHFLHAVEVGWHLPCPHGTHTAQSHHKFGWHTLHSDPISTCYHKAKESMLLCKSVFIHMRAYSAAYWHYVNASVSLSMFISLSFIVFVNVNFICHT